MTRFITTKVLGYLAGGLGLALVAAVLFGFIQTERLQATRLALAARELVIQTLEHRITNDQHLIAQRDALINEQNDAVAALAKASEENRRGYVLRVRLAERRADTMQAQAADIMSRQLDTQDELERSRAALRLIHEVLGQEKL
jgi:hypothetical protein